MDAVARELAAITGPEHVLTDPDLTAGYTADWTRRFRGTARCVVRPGATAEVAAVLAACSRLGAPVVTQGGNTGLSGGGVPGRRPAVLLSTRRLRRLDPVDTLSAQVTAGAGVTIAELRQHAAGRPGVRGGPGLTGVRHGGRHDRHQRGRRPGHQVRPDPGAAGRLERCWPTAG